MIYAVTVSIDIQTLDPRLPAQLMGSMRLEPGMMRAIPRGVVGSTGWKLWTSKRGP